MADEGSTRVETLAVIVRFTQYDTSNPEDWVALKAAYRELAAAEQEVVRLNALPQKGRPVRYFVKIVELVRDGRDSEIR
jgi:hypothetical protein